MKYIFTCIVLAGLLASSCNSVKNIYNTGNVNDRQLEKLVKNFLKNPADTSTANQLQYAYQQILGVHLNYIEMLKRNNSLEHSEQLAGRYDELQAFYNLANQHPMVRQLLKPGDVTEDKKRAVYNAAEAWYEHGNQLLDNNNWQSGREAYGVFRKVDNWIPNFRDSRLRIQDAIALGTIDAVIQPVRTEGYFYSSHYGNTSRRFTQQLVSDLGNTWNNSGMYRVYAAGENWYRQTDPDWVIEPVITRFTIEPVTYTSSTKTVTKQIEAGKDSLKNPVYKNISAILTITEASVSAVSVLEARIHDVDSHGPVSRRIFSENIVLKEVSATYSGDKNALGSEDWRLVNNRNKLRIDETWMQEKLLEKMYPDLLTYLKHALQ